MYPIIKIASFSVWQALCSTVIALIFGLAAAFFTARRRFPGRNFLLSLSSVPFCIPSLLIALGYVSFFGMSGQLNNLLKFITGAQKPPLTFLYSFWGIIICHGFYNFPLVMSTVSAGWERLPSAQSDAAELLGASRFRIFRTITIYQLMPSIMSACIPVFLYCFFSFMIVLMFGSIGTTTLEVETYHQAKVNLNYIMALKTGTLETIIALLFVLIYSLIEQKSLSLKGVSWKNQLKPKQKIQGMELFPAIILFSILFLFFICPLAAIVSNGLSSIRLRSNFTFYNFIHLFKSRAFRNALLWTCITASMTGFFCALTAFIYSVILKTYDPKNRRLSLRIIPLLPMAVSSVVTGVLLTMLVKRGNFLILVLSQTLLNWPVAFRQIYSDMEKIPQNTADAAVLFSKTPLDVIFKLYLPVCKNAFMRAAGFCFAISAGDATLPLILAIPRFDSLSLYTYRLAGSYKFNEACASGAILGILCALIFTISKRKK